ncbi:MAG: dihydrofolate reductase [Bauldia sp.]|nr:dihydrofolate reductase [Bauldia sp.]
MNPSLSLVAAIAENGVIGLRGGMPWRLSTDMRRFRALTIGKAVIMGGVTFRGLKAPLAQRLNVVVTRSGLPSSGLVVSVDSLDAAFAAIRAPGTGFPPDEAMVIGGAAIYRDTIALADRLHITHVDARPDGDTFFPRIDPTAWRPVQREEVPAGPKDDFATTYIVYERREPPLAVDGGGRDPQFWRDGDVGELLAEAAELRRPA